MSNNETGFIKILFLVLILGLCGINSGCSEINFQGYTSDSNQKIIGGEPVEEKSPLSKEVLYLSRGSKLFKIPGGMAAEQKGYCTAVAIAPKIVLTAAHCVDEYLAHEHYIILGMAPWKSKFNPNLWYKVSKAILYPGYKKKPEGGSVHDLALLKLETELPLDRVVRLATAEHTKPVMSFIMAGFGKTTASVITNPEESNNYTGELYWIKKITENYSLSDLTILIDQNDLTGLCHGDSGGAGLIVDEKTNSYVIAGIVSGYTHKLDSTFDPENKYECYGKGVYTNVVNPDYRNWIIKSATEL